MGCRVQPVGITLTNAQQRSVAHIHRYNQSLLVGGIYRTLAQYHVYGVDVVVDGVEAVVVEVLPVHVLGYHLGHRFAVQAGVGLAYLHIVQIVVHQAAGKIGQLHILYLRL